MSETFDVLVIGGGPAGSTAATRCVQRGLRTALLEHKKFPRHKVCGDVINPNCWPVFERLGVAKDIRALPQQRVSGALFTTVRDARIDVPIRSNMIALPRSLLDTCLLDHARASGVTVFEGETAHEILPQGRVLTGQREFRTRVLIGADGRHSVVAKNTGLRRNRRDVNGHVAFQAHFRAPAEMDDRVQLHLFPGGYCGLVRVDAGRVNLCLVTDAAGARAHRNCEELFARTVWRNPAFRALGIAPEPIEPLQSAHPLWSRLNLPAADGVVLVGDALRTVEPFTGQGIFFALRTAELAAETIGFPDRYATAVRRLYQHRGRTNQLVRWLMYRERAARGAIGVLTRSPVVLRWLADNVLE